MDKRPGSLSAALNANPVLGNLSDYLCSCGHRAVWIGWIVDVPLRLANFNLEDAWPMIRVGT